MRWLAAVLVAVLGATGCSGSSDAQHEASVHRTDSTGAASATTAAPRTGDQTTTSAAAVASRSGTPVLAPRPTVWVDTTPTTRATEEGDPTPTALPGPPAYGVPEPPAPAGADDRATATAAARRYTAGLLTGDTGQSWEQVVTSLDPVVTPAHRADLAASGPPALGRTSRARVTSATQVQSGAWRCSAEIYDLTDQFGAAPRPRFEVWDLTVVPTADGWRVQTGVRVA